MPKPPTLLSLPRRRLAIRTIAPFVAERHQPSVGQIVAKRLCACPFAIYGRGSFPESGDYYDSGLELINVQ